jgi:hypothetical protein
MGPHPRPYDGMSDNELMDHAKVLMTAWLREPVGSIERAMKAAAHESVMNELKRRMALHINRELGLPDVDL